MGSVGIEKDGRRVLNMERSGKTVSQQEITGKMPSACFMGKIYLSNPIYHI